MPGRSSLATDPLEMPQAAVDAAEAGWSAPWSRPWSCRSMLSTCALHPRQYRRGLEIGVDVGLLDLEDSPAERKSARRLALPFLADPANLRERPVGFTWALRLNSLRVAAARAGLPAMDGPCFEVHDDGALRRDVEGFGRPRPLELAGV